MRLGHLFWEAILELTIRFTQTENQEQRRIQVAPYLNISFKRMSELISPKKQLDYILFNYDPNSSKQLNLFGIITLKNVGFGPMLNCCVSDVRFNDKSVPRPVPVLTQNALEPKGEYTISIGLRAEDGELDPSLIRKFPPGELLEDKPVFGAIDNKGAGRLSFYLCYQDILGNPYQQKISLEVQIVCEQSPNGPRKYVPSISLSEVGEREMRNTALKNRLVPIVLRSNSKEE